MIIYKTVNLLNDKIYIGQDVNNNPKYLGSGTLISRAIKKYGKSNFIKETIEICISQDHLNEREIYWIDKFNSRDLDIGYNIAIGGKSVMYKRKHTEKSKLKMSNSLINRIISETHRKNIGIASSNRSEETHKKLSISRRKRKLKSLTIDKMVKKKKEWNSTIEGKLHWRKLASIRCTIKFPLHQYTLDYKLIKVFNSLDELKTAYPKFQISNITRYLNSDRKHCYKFKWKQS